MPLVTMIRISCQNQVIMPAPSDLAETNCRGSCGCGVQSSLGPNVYYGMAHTH